jgi:hypothetical protein
MIKKPETIEEFRQFLIACYQVISGIPSGQICMDVNTLHKYDLPDPGPDHGNFIKEVTLHSNEWLHLYFFNEGGENDHLTVPENLQEVDISDVYLSNLLNGLGTGAFDLNLTIYEEKTNKSHKDIFLNRMKATLTALDKINI